ncbi:DUF3862 domain-containing protein [Marininema halotolerans]|uniref:Beta-lactamase inhibitor (BLIP) n=1 Tax=Marininema halotolerans TaxID=1155944 RepID=A0A1I6QK28_9BACL|nr:DUF3862 domain-containing protein [Marininema halotolerans]SFS52796.1 protein of unknown function [Marininema halotolerans]
MKKFLMIAGSVFVGFCLFGVACIALVGGAAVDEADKAIKKDLETPAGKGASAKSSDGKIATYKEYQKVKPGMTYEEVKKIIGQDGEETSNSEVGGIKTTIYDWMNNDGSNTSIIFQEDQVDSKSQFGLKE